jgi:acyl-CoA thioesterase
MTAARDPRQLAQAVGEALFPKDRLSAFLGLSLEAMGPGQASMRLRVRPEMANGVGTCHGGVIFSLADAAFAYACNSHDKMAVALGCSIEFLAPAQVGDELLAEAREQSASGTTGVYDVEVRNQCGQRIALFRGTSYRLRGKTILEPGQEG